MRIQVRSDKWLGASTRLDQSVAYTSRLSIVFFFSFVPLSGRLEEAIAAWTGIRQMDLAVDENVYAACQECLTRCGAWKVLAAHIREQHARHRADPDKTPALNPSQVAHTLRLAGRILRVPAMQTHHPVDRRMLDVLMLELQAVVPAAIWAETVRLLQSDERFSRPKKSDHSTRVSPTWADRDLRSESRR